MSVHQHVLRRCLTLGLLLFSCGRWDAVAVGGSSIIALTLPQGNLSDGAAGDGPEGFFYPLSEALTSVMSLAVDDVNAAGVASAPNGGNLSLSVVGGKTGIRAMEGLCDALEAVGENGTLGVSGACNLNSCILRTKNTPNEELLSFWRNTLLHFFFVLLHCWYKYIYTRYIISYLARYTCTLRSFDY